MTIFVYKGFDQKSGNQKYPRVSLIQYLETGVSQRYQIWYVTSVTVSVIGEGKPPEIV